MARAWAVECPWDDHEVILRTSRRPTTDGPRVRRDVLRPEEIAHRYGVAVTTPMRTAFDLARREPLEDAVAAVDVLARRCGVTGEHLLALARVHPGVRGLAQIRRVAELMDGRAGSIPETHARLVFVLRGVRPPIPQYEVICAGRSRFLDLAWPDVPPGRRKVGVEFDGPEHRTITGQNRDQLRDADLDDEEWEIIRIGAVQVYDDRRAGQLASRVQRLID